MTWPPSEGGYRALRDKYYTWNDYNEQLLRSRFSTGRLANEYWAMSVGLGGGDTEREKLADLTDAFNDKIAERRKPSWPKVCICGEHHQLLFTTATGQLIEPRNLKRRTRMSTLTV